MLPTENPREQNTQPNPCNSISPEYYLDDRPAQLGVDRIVNGDGRVVAVCHTGKRTPEEATRDTRMFSFAGKTHCALGNAVSAMKSASHDLELIASKATSLEEIKEFVSRIAGTLRQSAQAEVKAYDGALLTGEKAVAFDKAWRQGGLPTDQDLLDAGDVAGFRERYPEVSPENVAALIENGKDQSHSARLLAISSAITVGRGEVIEVKKTGRPRTLPAPSGRPQCEFELA